MYLLILTSQAKSNRNAEGSGSMVGWYKTVAIRSLNWDCIRNVWTADVYSKE